VSPVFTFRDSNRLKPVNGNHVTSSSNVDASDDGSKGSKYQSKESFIKP